MTNVDELGAQFTSPGAALSAQKRLETRLENALDSSTFSMLTTLKHGVLARSMTTANAARLWDDVVTGALADIGFTPGSDEFTFLAPQLLAVNLGSEAYASAMAVMRKAAETYPAPSDEDIEEALDEVLSLETPSVLASGRHNAADAKHRANTPFLSQIGATMRSIGLNWQAKLNQLTRTSFTGFSGYIALKAMRGLNRENKQWVTRHDNDVRTTHAAVDGTVIPIEQAFLVGGSLLQYPGDPSGAFDEIVNCRCLMVSPR